MSYYGNELAGLSSYLEAFGFAPGLSATPTLVLPTEELSNDFPLKLVQAFLKSKGFKGANKKPLAVDDAWGKNTEFALNSFDAALQKQRGGGPRLAKVWRRIPAGNLVGFEAAVGQMIRSWTKLDAGAKKIMSEPAIAARLPADMRLAPAAKGTTAQIPAGKLPPGTAVEKTGNLNQIARAFGIDIKVDTPYGPDVRDAWAFLGKTFGVDGSTSPAGQNRYDVLVNANAYATLRVKSRSAKAVPMSMADVRRKLGAAAPAAPQRRAAPGAKPTQPSKPGMQQVSVGSVQDILLGLKVGIGPAGRDGLWGSNTANGWAATARARGLDGTINRAAPNQAWVMPATFKALAAAAAKPKPPAPVPKAPTEAPAPAEGNMTAPVSVADIQGILRKLGWSKEGRDDGKWGPKTKGAWESSSKRRNLDPWSMGKTGATKVIVRPATLQRLAKDAAAAKPAPKPAPTTPTTPARPTEPSKQGMQKVGVGAVQDILIALKVSVGKKGRDGEWGPDTRNAWVATAAKRKLDPAIDRAGPNEAWVMPETFRKLGVEAGLIKPEPKPAKPEPKPAKPEPKPPAPAPGPAPKPAKPAPTKPDDVVVVQAAQIARIFKLCGVATPSSVDGLKAAWAALARQETAAGAKMSPGATYLAPEPLPPGAKPVVVPGIEVSKATFDLLSDRCTKRAVALEILSQATVTVPVKLLQQALRQFKDLERLKLTGVWNQATEVGFIKYIVNNPKLVQAWEQAIPKLLGGKKQSIKVTSSQAERIGKLAKQQQQRTKAKKAAAKLANFQRVTKSFLLGLLNDADLSDEVISSKLTLAQLKPIYDRMAKALDAKANTEMLPGDKPNEVRLHKDTIRLFESSAKGSIPRFIAPLVQRSDTLVNARLLGQAMMFVRTLQDKGEAKGVAPGPKFPKWDQSTPRVNFWQPAYNSFLMRTVGTFMFPGMADLDTKVFDAAVDRLRAKGAKTGVAGVDVIMLPEAAAQRIQSWAAEYVASLGNGKKAEPVLKVPVGPKGPKKVAGEPIKITGKVEPPAPAPPVQPTEPEPTPLIEPTPVPTGEDIQVPVIQMPEGPRSDIQTGRTEVGPTTAGGAQVTGPSITGPSITGPSINIQIPSAPAPVAPAPVAPAPVLPEPAPVVLPEKKDSNTALVVAGVAIAGILGYMLFSGAAGAAKKDGSPSEVY